MTKAASLNPDNIPGKAPQTDGFAALVHVTKSRYVKREYQGDIAAKVAIQWTMGTTKGNSFERMWSTGVVWEDSLVSPDGKEFYGTISKGSDAFYALQKVRATEFPADQLGSDVSVFEGHVFFMADDQNPHAKGSSRKLYPKYYRGTDWNAAVKDQLERRAAREAKEQARTYQTPASSYAPPQTPQTDPSVLSDAGKALNAILTANNGRVERQEILSKLAAYVNTNKIQWTPDYSNKIRLALFDMSQLKAVVASNPNITLNGETITSA